MKPKKCDCWVCSEHLTNIRRKLKGKKLLWFDALTARCIQAEDDLEYMKWKKK